jgi:transcriptional regulator with XRE-family HTH domain
MAERANQLRGEILQAWRKYAKRSQLDLAANLGIDSAVLSSWETGKRGRPSRIIGKISQIPGELGLTDEEGSTFVDMWLAAGSYSVIPEQFIWWKNYQQAGGPVWVLLRWQPRAEAMTVSLSWGPTWTELKLPTSHMAMIITAPASATNPPLKVQFSHPAWADFGYGTVPDEVIERLDLKHFKATGLLGGRIRDLPPELTPDERNRKDLVGPLRWVEAKASNLGLNTERMWPYLGGMRPHEPVRSLNEPAPAPSTWLGEVVTRETGILNTQLLLRPEEIKDIRSERGYTRESAAADITEVGRAARIPEPVTVGDLEALETAGRLPQGKLVLSRMDIAYRLDGQLCIERTFDSRSASRPRDRGGYTIDFPIFWVGPIWLQPIGPDLEEEAEMSLIWGPWRRKQLVRSGTVVTTRKAAVGEAPLQIKLPVGWGVTAGVGAVSTALDINDDWFPVSFAAGVTLIGDALHKMASGLWPRPKLRLDAARRYALPPHAGLEEVLGRLSNEQPPEQD